MNQQQLQAEETSTTVQASSFSTPLLPAVENAAQIFEAQTLLETETPLETKQALREIGAANSYLLPLLQAEARQVKRDTRNIFLTLLLFMGGMAWVVNRALADDGQIVQYRLLGFALMSLLTVAIIAYLSHRSYRRKHALAAELAKPMAVDSIGALVDAIRVENTQVRNLSKRALTGLLPQLKASNGDLLTEAHRDRLILLLTISPNDKGYRDLTELFSGSAYRREIDVRVAILKAYEQVGGPKELPQVERLAKGQIHWQSMCRVPPEVQQAANECLPYLQARTSEQRASEQLLRASSGNAIPADILLRPSDERPDATPEQLLRASERRITIHLSEP